MVDPERTTLVVPSPVGLLALTAEGDALVEVDLAVSPESSTSVADPTSASPLLAEAARQLDAYFAGELREFDLPLRPHGTPFQLAVWDALREIPYGQTASYADVARRIGRPTAARAVGHANGRNPLAVVVPCHRVIGSDGSLTGYAGGLEMKRVLLALEAGARH
jgi:methylated-DNA-[protein]-cysteine S-methyltransferase